MNSQPAGFKALVKDGGFQAFLWTQFLGALNDNLYKTIVSLRAVHAAAKSGNESLALAGAVFVAPFLLFSGYSGYLADRVSKRSVMIAVKVFEVGVMVAGLATFFSDRMEWMLAVLFLMALHSTVFSPAKYGIVPEMLPESELSRANGLLEMSTFVAIVLGTSLSSFAFTIWNGEPWKMGFAMIGVAVAGWLTSFRIPRTVTTASTAPFRSNPLAEVITGTRHMLRDRALSLTVVGISYFWMLGALFQMDLLLYGGETLRVNDVRIGLMLTALAVGIGAGSLLAGKVSGDRVELGLVPAGSILMGVCGIGLWAAKSSYGWSMVMLAALGLASGLYIVPLNAFLQQRSESGEKGRMIATNNFYNTIGLLLASGVLWLVHDRMGASPEKLILAAGMATLVATVYILGLLPDHFVRLVLRSVMRMLFRIRVEGIANVPRKGAALLVCNHVSFVDGLLLGAALDRRVRFMIWKPYYEHWALNWFFRQVRAIPVGNSGPRDMVAALAAARKQLEQGHLVCIFAEGSITRTGNLQPFKRGMERIVDGLDIPVVPVYLDRLWGSIFSYSGGRFLSKLPRRIPYPVTVMFGAPMRASAGAQEVHQAVLELGPEAVRLRKTEGDTLPMRLIRNARRNWSGMAMADSTGQNLTSGRALTAAVLFSGWVRGHAREEEKIGLLLPASAGGAIANLGISLSGRIPVNLNFTSGREAMASAIEQCSIRTIVASRVFLEKAKIEAPEGVVYLEDILKSFSAAQKFRALVRARFAPASTLTPARDPDALATVLFSSGSTAMPKGIMLSHYNIISDIEAILQVFDLSAEDRVVGVLPFFHSFGFAITIWLPVLADCGAIYHANPTDAKTIGDLVQRNRGTLLLTTSTFASAYARKCTKDQFASLRLVLAGAEKLRPEIAQIFEDAFGLKILEGYGCTEMSPVVAVNTPDYRAGRDSQQGTRPGTVGRPLPGVAVRIVDPETRAAVPAGSEGLLLVKGANLMLGYLGQPQKTAETVQDGWYNTGDLAVFGEDGFLSITGRLARFSKIGGEMVSHVKIEDTLREITGAPCAVTGIPDARKGERIAALYTASELTPDEVWSRLSATGLPKLWLPKREDIRQVSALPTLGTGKLDLRAVAREFESLVS